MRGSLGSPRAATGAPYQLFVLTLSIYAIAALGFETITRPSDDVRKILAYGDALVCAVFLLDFVVTLVRAENRWRYLATWGWLDLLSSIPTVDALRIGRLGRIARIFRVLRGVRATKLVATLVLERRAQSAMAAAALVSVMLCIFGSIAILHFESVPEANIKSPEDAMWWSIVTLTTVGYGDRFPVTTEGRGLAILLMTAGVGLFGTFSGFVASWFLKPDNVREEDGIAALRDEIAALRRTLEHGRGADGSARPPG